MPMICGPEGRDPVFLGCTKPNVRACVMLVSPAPEVSTCSSVTTLENGGLAELVSSKPRAAMQRWISRALAAARAPCCWGGGAREAARGERGVPPGGGGGGRGGGGWWGGGGGGGWAARGSGGAIRRRRCRR